MAMGAVPAVLQKLEVLGTYSSTSRSKTCCIYRFIPSEFPLQPVLILSCSYSVQERTWVGAAGPQQSAYHICFVSYTSHYNSISHTHTHTVHPPTHTPLPSPSAAVYVVFTLLRASGHTECTRAAYCRPPGGPACFGLIVIMSSMRMIVTAASVAKRICFSFESAGSTTPF